MKKMLKVLKRVKHPFIVNGTSCANHIGTVSCGVGGSIPAG